MFIQLRNTSLTLKKYMKRGSKENAKCVGPSYSNVYAKHYAGWWRMFSEGRYTNKIL
jgi:hypothetical protein